MNPTDFEIVGALMPVIGITLGLIVVGLFKWADKGPR